MDRPDPQPYITRLKPFQRDTVEYVFRRFYEDEPPQRRFLIADEVGLGKTLVAAAVIARMTDHLWESIPAFGPINIVYICSNQSIARQNIQRLNVMKSEDVAFASRLTLLPLELDAMEERPLNLIAFTPSTSLAPGHRTGRKKERLLLYWMLREIWGLSGSRRYVNLLRGRVQHENWRPSICNFHKNNHINPDLMDAFADQLKQVCQEARKQGEPTIRDDFEGAAELYRRMRWSRRPDDHIETQLDIIGRLRAHLARACVQHLHPDLIILDEFQRFRQILDDDSEMSELTHYLFDYTGRERPGVTGGPRILLLSATPYKMYTMYHEEEDDHYKDFLRTTKFLFGSRDAVLEQLEDLLQHFRTSLLTAGLSQDQPRQIRQEIQELLRQVMLRTERRRQLTGSNGTSVEEVCTGLRPQDVAHYRCLADAAKTVQARGTMEYWKSAPYVTSIMDRSYQLKERLMDAVKLNDDGSCAGDEEQAQELARTLEPNSLDDEVMQQYADLDPGNPRMRFLVEETVERSEAWRLLWVPPSLPYYKPQGAYGRPQCRRFSKFLIFSSWRVVPKAISMMTSYAAEQRMMAGTNLTYQNLTSQRNPLLLFNLEAGRPRSMPSMALFYPCVSLARLVDPCIMGASMTVGGAPPTYTTLAEAVGRKIKQALQEAGVVSDDKMAPRTARENLWKVMVLLDRQRLGGGGEHPVQRWLGTSDRRLHWQRMVSGRGDGDDGARGFFTHVAALRDFWDSWSSPTMKVHPSVVELLTNVALASPAVTAVRALERMTGRVPDDQLQHLLAAGARVAMGFRTKFNHPWTIELVRRGDQNTPYWWEVLEHCRNGNIQAMLDEYLHLLVDMDGLRGESVPDMLRTLSEHVHAVLSIHAANPEYQVFDPSEPELVRDGSIRTHFGLAFGEDRQVLDPGSQMRSDIVRHAFNGPFHPFVLATTSVGQEGLDFHGYCLRVVHWNLPSNPVDLEQREGRIDRYKGHVVRRNVARDVGLSALRGVAPGQDPWGRLFQVAEKCLLSRGATQRGLAPYWFYETDEGESLQRLVPLIPYSRELYKMEALRRSRAYYRMVFGQPRQEDMVEYLQSVHDSLPLEEIERMVGEYRVDLTPPANSR